LKYLGPNADLDSAPFLDVDLDDGVLSIALNRPQQRNAINPVMSFAIQKLLTAVSGDETVRVVVLRGNGPAFCAGLETAGMSDVAASDGQALRKLAQPVIAMVHGQCHGAAIALIESCDIVIAADDADFDLGDKEAQRNDLVTLSVPASELETQTYQLARELAGKDALALRFTKETLQRVADLSWDEVLNFTGAKQAELKSLQDGRPSMRALAVESFLSGKTKPGTGG
jgi:trans-feruloyl-CoA hydratase/vanillin synthase